jgi:hypothetical protein
MSSDALFTLILTAFCLYCTGASWLLQVVCYPTYLLVGNAEFVPFHVSFGRRLMVAVIPMTLTCLGMFALGVLRADMIPLGLVIAIAVCGAIILLTTIFLEVPKHLRLDREGKSDSLIRALVRDNLPRTAAWTVASGLLLYTLTIYMSS